MNILVVAGLAFLGLMVWLVLRAAKRLEVLLAEVSDALDGAPAPELDVDEVTCSICVKVVPRWFTERVDDRTMCYHDTGDKPYPLPGETEDAYVERLLVIKRGREPRAQA